MDVSTDGLSFASSVVRSFVAGVVLDGVIGHLNVLRSRRAVRQLQLILTDVSEQVTSCPPMLPAFRKW